MANEMVINEMKARASELKDLAEKHRQAASKGRNRVEESEKLAGECEAIAEDYLYAVAKLESEAVPVAIAAD